MTGLFGVVSEQDANLSMFYGTDYHSHLGTKYGGIAYIDEKGDPLKKIHDISNSQFKSKFFDELNGIESHLSIGVISDKDPQPLTFVSKFGPFAIAMNGLIINKEQIKEKMIEDGTCFAEVYHGEINQADLVANLINQGDSIEDGISRMWDSIDGSASLLILTKEGIYAARDINGISPLVVGENGPRLYLSSEEAAIRTMDPEIETIYMPRAGEPVIGRVVE